MRDTAVRGADDASRPSHRPPRFRAGDPVRTRPVDPPHHTRSPRYARGQFGEVVAVQGAYPLPDDRARRLPAPRVEAVYTVRFAARDLWGEGAHHVTVDLWESYLEPAPGEGHAGRPHGPPGVPGKAPDRRPGGSAANARRDER